MRINIGPEKSAVMIINDQGLDTDMREWRIGARLLPIVHTYKYMGQALQVTGRWDEWLKTLVRRTKLKTAELVRWARANHITIDILAPLWTVYVEKAAEWGLASTTLTTTQTKALDTAQRMAARQILGHSSTSPWPSPCLELGWQTWSSQIAPQKMRLYKRLLDSDNRIVKAILDRSKALEQGWLAETEEHIKAAFPLGLPKQSSKWRQHSRQWEAMQKTIGQGAPHLQQPATPQSGSLLPTTNPALRRARHQPRNPPSHIQQQSFNYDIKASLRGTRPQGRGPPAAHRGVHAQSMHILPQPGSTKIRDPMAFSA